MRLARAEALSTGVARSLDPRGALFLGGAVVAAILGFATSAPLVLMAAVLLAGLVLCVGISFHHPRWALVFALFLGWGYILDVASLYHGNGLPLTGALLALLIVPLCVRQLIGVERLQVPWLELNLVLALLFTMFVSLEMSVEPSAGEHRLVLFAKDVPFMLLMLLVIDRIEWLRRAVWAAVLAFGGLGALAVVQQVTGTYDRSYFGFAAVEVGQGLVRSSGPLSTDAFGWELVPVTVLALYLALGARKRNIRILAWSLFGFSLLGLIFSFARASLIAIAVALVLAAILRRVALATLAMAIVVSATALVFFLPAPAKDRLVQTVAPFTEQGGVAAAQDASVRGRAGENIAAVHMFVDHPYFGVGPGNYPVLYTQYSKFIALDDRNEGRHPHNLYLEYFAETGMAGGFLILTFIGLALRGAWRARRVFSGRDRLLVEGVFVAMVGYFVNAIFLHPSAYSRYLWLVLGLGLVAGRLARREEATP
jgi:putative inorganic carbon (HCO3(-)) transporter